MIVLSDLSKAAGARGAGQGLAGVAVCSDFGGGEGWYHATGHLTGWDGTNGSFLDASSHSTGTALRFFIVDYE